MKTAKKNYRAGLHEVNFKTSPETVEAARQIINAWVEKETNEKIKNLIPDKVLTQDARLVLTNAIYFKGDWACSLIRSRRVSRNSR